MDALSRFSAITGSNLPMESYPLLASPQNIGATEIVIVVPTFKENGILMLGVLFLFSQFSPIEIIIFNKKSLYPIEDIDFLSLKR